MYSGKSHRGARRLVGVATIVCWILGGPAFAGNPPVTVSLKVSGQGLDLSRPTDAQTFYNRLKAAARVVCTHGDRVDLVPVDDPKACYEKSLAEAVRSVKAPLLIQIYLANHTVQGASTGWTYVPVPAASQ